MNSALDSKHCHSYVRLAVVIITLITTSGCASHAAVNNNDCPAAQGQASPVVSCGKTADTPALDAEGRIKAELQTIEGYKRDESQTYLTLPEWYLVYSPAEYARFLKEKPPSGFPYFGSIGQFWGYYGDINDVTKDRYPFNGGYHTMVMVIGTSFTVENAVKGIYENTMGRVTEWTSSDAMTDEDRFAARVAQSYVDLIRVEPWYEYSFAKELIGLWTETSFFGSNMIRKVERKLALSVGYSVTAVYATLIKLGTKLAYGDADTEMLVLAKGLTPEILANEPKVKVKARYEESYLLLSLPRYEEFREVSLRLVNKGVRFSEIAGNEQILVTCIVPADWKYDLSSGKALFERPILTDPSQKRIAISAPVKSLHEILINLTDRNISIEHIYDY
jgi:hypothetical protein